MYLLQTFAVSKVLAENARHLQNGNDGFFPNSILLSILGMAKIIGHKLPKALYTVQL
jgi:hypothetical protein